MNNVSRERPILFSGPMVRAILEGRKSQTRRTVKGVALDWLANGFTPKYTALAENGLCPYGQPGDRLWVRETFGLATGELSYRWAPGKVLYRADHGIDIAGPEVDCMRWRPSIHMPRSYSRITLEVAEVRVERLQDISEEDAQAEGVEPLDSTAPEERSGRDFDSSLCENCGGLRLYTAFRDGGACPDTDCRDCDTHAKRFRHLWTSINGADSWPANPWVWAFTFKQVQP